MPVPKQVKAQVKEAERLAAEIYPVAAQSEVLAEQENDPANELQFVEKVEGEVPAPITAEPKVDPVPEPIEAAEDGLEHKYKTLQGMYNSEKRRNVDLTDRVGGLEEMLASLQEVKAANKPTAAEVEAVKQLITDEEREDYGADLIDVMKRAAREAVQEELEGLRSENQQLKQVVGNVGQKQETSDREKFYTAMDAQVPDWKTINQNQDFLNWLDEEDVYAGATRSSLLHKAYGANNVTRVARFFTGFLNENAAVSQATQQDNAPKPEGKGKVDLAALAAPGSGNSGSADNTSKGSGKMWKESDIGAFYDASRQGKYKGREAEYKRTENDIQSALSEGRILLGQ
jgi:hypothetical protein